MTTQQPQPGDLVRATYVGIVHEGDDGLALTAGGQDSLWLHTAESVTVLPKPVYANHDTVAWQNGDVVRTELGSALVRQDDCWNGANSGIGYGDSEVRELTLTLLVRDGQPVTS